MHGFGDPTVAQHWRKAVQARARTRRLRQDGALLRLIRTVALVRRVRLMDLFDDDRSSAASYARQVGMYLAHVELGRSQKEVGIVFGREPSTVSHACRRIEALRDSPLIEAEIDDIERRFRAGERRHVH